MIKNLSGKSSTEIGKILTVIYERLLNAEENVRDLILKNKEQDLLINELTGNVQRLEEDKGLQQGLINRLEKDIAHSQDKILHLEEKQMSNNIILENIPEVKGQDAEFAVKSFIRANLKLASIGMRFDICHRFGSVTKDELGNTKPRPIIARFLNRTTRNLVLSKGPLLRGTDIKMYGQVPQELRAAQSVLYQHRKELKNNNPACKVTIKGKKLIADGVVKHDLSLQQYSEVGPDTERSFLAQVNALNPKSSNEVVEKDSRFMAHYVPIDDPKQIKAALAAIRRSDAVSRVTRNIWAARTGDIEFLDDDREYGASQHVLKAMRSSKVRGLCCVSR